MIDGADIGQGTCDLLRFREVQSDSVGIAAYLCGSRLGM
jgi:hypothetical protein